MMVDAVTEQLRVQQQRVELLATATAAAGLFERLTLTLTLTLVTHPDGLPTTTRPRRVANTPHQKPYPSAGGVATDYMYRTSIPTLRHRASPAQTKDWRLRGRQAWYHSGMACAVTLRARLRWKHVTSTPAVLEERRRRLLQLRTRQQLNKAARDHFERAGAGGAGGGGRRSDGGAGGRVAYGPLEVLSYVSRRMIPSYAILRRVLMEVGDNAPIMLDRGERSQHPAARARKGAVLFFPRSSAWLGNSRLVSLVFPFPCFG